MITICRKATAILLLCCYAAMADGQKRGLSEQWITTGDSNILFKQLPLAKLIASAGDAEIVIDSKKVFQTIDGFGYALTQGSAMHFMQMSTARRRALLLELFDTAASDIGVSYLRLSIGASDLNDALCSYDDVADDTTLSRFSILPDKKEVLPVLKEILQVNPAIKIMASPWSPPAWMKTNNDTRGGRLKPEYYHAYANYLIKYLRAMFDEGITIDALTIQNEPLHPGNNPSLLMTAPEQANFIKYHLGPAIKQLGLKTKIVIYDHNANRPDYPLFILNDPEAAKYVDGSGFHLYEGKTDALSYVHDQHPDKHIYLTEQWVVQFNENRKSQAPRLNISGVVSELLIGATRNWSRNVLQWNIASNAALTPYTDRGGCEMCQGAVTIDGDSVKRNLAYYTMAHFSKFVRPGAVRIASSMATDLPNVAFRNADGTMVLVVANTGLKQQTIRVKPGSVAYLVSLPGKSVATYVF